MLLNRMRIHETKCLCKGLEESKWETSVDQEEIRLCFLLSFIWLVSTANQRWFTISMNAGSPFLSLYSIYSLKPIALPHVLHFHYPPLSCIVIVVVI